MEGLLGISHSGKIYASDSRYLNDSTDSAHLFGLLTDYVEQRIIDTGDADRKHYGELASALKTTRMAEVFVASFSEDGDSLSQWRAYCPNGLGFCIGFSSESLLAARVLVGESEWRTGWLRKVRYLSQVDYSPREFLDTASMAGHMMLTKAAVDKLVPNTSSAENLKTSAATAAFLSIVAPIFKHYAFKEEREWRLIFSEASRQMPGKQFRLGKSMLVPYVQVEPKATRGYFIKEVIVGPTPHPELSVESVRALFRSLNHPEVIVRASKVPYRHW